MKSTLKGMLDNCIHLLCIRYNSKTFVNFSFITKNKVFIVRLDLGNMRKIYTSLQMLCVVFITF